jgi:hypothetical protein
VTGPIDIEQRLKAAIQSYWDARARNKDKQIESGRIDAGTSGEVTGSTQMGALEVLVSDILCEAGLKRLDVRTRTSLELPGYFRATKKWDLIVVSEGRLVLAMEFKSQCSRRVTSCVTLSARCLGLDHQPGVALARGRIVVVLDQRREGARTIDDVQRMLVEQLEEVAFARQQLA